MWLIFLKKPLLILAISASFIAGTLVTGNFVFADPADGQNSLLGQILQAIQTQNNELIGLTFPTSPFVLFTCPDNSQREMVDQNFGVFSYNIDFDFNSGNRLFLGNGPETIFMNVLDGTLVGIILK